MSNQNQAFVLGTDGNLWSETGDWKNISDTLKNRLQVDGNVNQVFSQVGGNRIWRPAFQPLNTKEIFVLGSDGNLWYEPGPFGDVSQVIANRLQVDGNVYQFWAINSNTVFVLGTDGNLWLETGPWGNVPEMIQRRQQVDGNVLSFQVMDSQTLFVLGTDGNLWFEPGRGETSPT